MEKKSKELSFTKKLEKIQKYIEKLAIDIRKCENITKQCDHYTKKEYHKVKAKILNLILKISLQIEEYFSLEEKRKVDAKIVIESYNSYVQKMKAIVEREDCYSFKAKEKKEIKQSEQQNMSIKNVEQMSNTNHQINFEEEKKNYQDLDFQFEEVVCMTKKQSLDILSVAEYQDESELTADQLDKITNIVSSVNQISKGQLEQIIKADEKIKKIDTEIQNATEDTRVAGINIQKASKEKARGIKYFLGGVLGGIGGALGAIFGAGVGAGVGVGGGYAVGHSIGSKIEKLTKKKYGNIKFQGPQKPLEVIPQTDQINLESSNILQ
ncbi:UNKNOWN [Stylonychia lemnae]|uniref:t-SNARE coiled-coil homology domain-containing protein n=1 Tax=Stylonychia lemnae TaxID=5949 RepID=A0A078AT02_STYLE|nr:UNKNOWN [Stylonychia lemnae]|eukprot:CDW85146.1 UNKNOWN [Stylonychia lemnae]